MNPLGFFLDLRIFRIPRRCRGEIWSQTMKTIFVPVLFITALIFSLAYLAFDIMFVEPAATAIVASRGRLARLS
jgi:hypothetical protein